MNINLNNNWKYHENFDESLINNLGDEGESVRLPHTFNIMDSNYANPILYQRDSIYVKKIEFDEKWNDKRVFLNIEGAAHYSEVYLNGKLINEHRCGYTAFKTELTNELVKGENILAIRVDSRERQDIPPFGGTVDYLAYSGLYRDVSLEIKEKSYIEDVYVHTKGKELTADTVIENDNERYLLNYKLLDNNQITDLGSELNSKECDIVFWDVDNPKLYTLIVSLYDNDNLIDQKKIRFGFRDIRFEKDGFYINGKKLKLRGLNRHQSYTYMGYAMPKSGQINDADLLKNELGLNCVRTSHYPQSKYFVDRCDEIGLLVFTEIPGWQHIGDEDWQKISIDNVSDMVMQYRNHPSIMLWGVRINESKDLDSFYKKTNDVARKLDPYRQTGGVRCYENGHLLEDVYTFNDFLHDGKNAGVKSRKKVTGSDEVSYLVTEYNGHMFPCKPFDSEEKLLEHALRHARVLNDIAMHNDIAGGFGWCMSDYQTHVDFGGDDIICYHGVTDMFRNLKPAGYVYKSQSDSEHVMEIMPSMNLGENPASTLGKVYAFTNVDYIELFIDNRFINRFYPDVKNYGALLHPPIEIDDIIGDKLDDEKYNGNTKKSIKKLLLKYSREGLSSFTIKDKLEALKLIAFNGMKAFEFTRLYETYIGNWGGKRAEFKFVGYINDKEVATVIKGAYESKHLETKVDRLDLIDDETYDVATVKLRMLNQNNQVMRYYQEPIEIETEGPIEIIGPKLISLKGGMGGTYVKTLAATGKAKLIFKVHGEENIIVDFTVNITRRRRNMKNRSSEIFGNTMDDKVLKKAEKTKLKFEKKFGDDSKSEYGYHLENNDTLGKIIGVKNMVIGDGEDIYDDKAIIIGNIRMGFGHYRISMAMASAANSLGYVPYWMDLNAMSDSTGGKVISNQNDLYSFGSRLSSKSKLFNKFYWEPLNYEGFRKISYNAVDQKNAELMAPLFNNVPNDIPVIATHVWPAQAAIHGNMKYVVNAIPDNWPMALHLAEGSVHTVQTHSSYLGYRLLNGMDGKKVLKPIPKESIKETGHYIDHELVSNIEDDCEKRIRRSKDGEPIRFLLTIGGAGAQKEIFAAIIKHLIPYIKRKEVVLFVNVGDYEEVWYELINEIDGMKNITKEHLNEWDNSVKYANEWLDKKVYGIHGFYHEDIFRAVYITNLLMRCSDVLVTKPSELAFYPIPKLFIKRVGGHEKWGAIHSAEIGDGSIECGDIPHVVQMLELMITDRNVINDMCENIIRNKSIGIYDGAYNAVKTAIKLKEEQ